METGGVKREAVRLASAEFNKVETVISFMMKSLLWIG